jgi:GPH family glycoside/pentoside/hexuronide:cation symporter
VVKDNAENNGFYKSVTSKKLDFKTKLAYGAGDLGPAITGNIATFYMMFFFTNVAGIPAGLAGSILMVSMILWWEC